MSQNNVPNVPSSRAGEKGMSRAERRDGWKKSSFEAPAAQQILDVWDIAMDGPSSMVRP